MEKKHTILVVDDDLFHLQAAASVLNECEYNTVLADSSELFFEYIASETPDLILLDNMMPGIDGYDMISWLKQFDEYNRIPVIFVTVGSDDYVKGFEVGASDFIRKPFDSMELKVRVRNQLRISDYQNQILEYNKELKNASNTDFLTGIHNRRYIQEKITQEIVRYKRSFTPFSVVMADIDFFKAVNDTYGHECGDVVLIEISRFLKSLIREIDSICRWGGEEFLLLLPETSKEDSIYLCERIRKKVKKLGMHYKDVIVKVTLTLGITEYNDVSLTMEDIVGKADRALYLGKKCGRNRTVSI